MQQLVKPSEYAKMHGLSRQSVYAKIKRGTLPSRKVDGRFYVIVSDDAVNDTRDETTTEEEPIEHVSLIEEYRQIIKAKDETIAVLKTSIADLKEANAQITQTLQHEITLLKQAFTEMKALYDKNRLIPGETVKSREAEQANEESEIIVVEPEKRSPERKESTANPSEKNRDETEEECWIPLGDLIQRKAYNYNKAKQVVKRFKKAYKKGDPRIRKQNGIYYISCYDFYEDILD